MKLTVTMALIMVGTVNSTICQIVLSEPAQRLPVTLVAGKWLEDEEAAGNAVATGTEMIAPFGVDFDAQGNMYIAELSGGRIHKLNGHQLETISGRKNAVGYDGDGGSALSATYNGMHNLAVSRAGSLYVADSWNHCVRRIDLANGQIETIAGTGEAGFRGDGSDARRAQFDFIMCVTLNPREDHLYLADLHNFRIRKIDLTSGIVTTVAGNGERGVPPDGAIATASPLVDPRAVAVDADDHVYVLERGGHALRVVRPDGKIFTVAGNGTPGSDDGVGTAARLNASKHLCVDDRGVVFIADDQSRRIRRYDPVTRQVTTVLGAGQGVPAVTLSHPHGVCVENGQLIVVDTGNNRILSIPTP